MLLKALLQVCTGNTAQGGMLRDKYSMRRSRVLYLSQDTPECCISSRRAKAVSAVFISRHPRLLYFLYRQAKAVL